MECETKNIWPLGGRNLSKPRNNIRNPMEKINLHYYSFRLVYFQNKQTKQNIIINMLPENPAEMICNDKTEMGSQC